MRILPTYLIALFLIVSTACSQYSKVLKSKNSQAKYKMAMEMYAKKDYLRAVALFDQLRDSYKNTDSLERVYYYSAMSYFHLKDYPYAALFFKDFTENFTRSARATECAYMALYCDYLNIGSHELDQSDTKNVLEAMQNFTNFNPDSEYTIKCNEHMDDLRSKLQAKEYDHVVLYYRMGEYRAAVSAAKTCIRLYPDIKQREELEYLTVKAQYLFAINSIERKRLERLKDVLVNIEDYQYNNDSKSAHFSEVMEIKTKTTKEIAAIEEINSIKPNKS